jgi:hypothetical protein
MTITCIDIDQFLNVIEGLVHRGIGFKADADKLTITLTGAN